MMTPTIERLLRDYDCGEIPRRNFLLSLAPLTAALRGMAQSSAPTIPLRALNHVTLTVSDVKRSLEFYQGLFGMPIQNRQTSMSASLQTGPGPQHIGLGRGGANAKPGINHFCVTTDNFDVNRILQVLAAHGVTKLDPLDANFPARGGALKSRVRIRREDAGGTKEGTPELYFTDPDGIVVQLQHTSYCAGSGYLGEVCPNKPEPAPTRGVLALRDLNHVTLGVSNQQRSREFYRDLFGMKVQAYQGPSPVHAIGSGPQFMAFGAGSANGGIPRTPQYRPLLHDRGQVRTRQSSQSARRFRRETEGELRRARGPADIVREHANGRSRRRARRNPGALFHRPRRNRRPASGYALLRWRRLSGRCMPPLTATVRR